MAAGVPRQWLRRALGLATGGVCLELAVGGCGRPVEPPSAPVVTEQGQISACPRRYALVDSWGGLGPEPVGVACDAAGRLYVAEGRGVATFGSDGRPLGLWRMPGAATCVAVGPDGTVYAGLAQGVEVFDSSGTRLRGWGKRGRAPGALLAVTGVAVSESEVLVADAGNRCVHRFALNGDFIAEVGRRDPAQQVPGIIVPSPHLNCAWSAAGEIWVNNPGRHQVERYDRDGRRLGGWGAPGFAPAQFVGCCNPTNLALLGGGADGVVVSEKGIPRIKVYSEQGQLLAYLGPELFSPKADGLALATDTQGRIYALDAPAAKVLVFAGVEPAAAEPSL